MKKLDELIESDEHFVRCYSLMLPIKEQIKELAIAYAKLCLEKAAEEAYMSRNGVGMIQNTGSIHGCEINKKSITDIELP